MFSIVKDSLGNRFLPEMVELEAWRG